MGDGRERARAGGGVHGRLTWVDVLVVAAVFIRCEGIGPPFGIREAKVRGGTRHKEKDVPDGHVYGIPFHF